MSASDRVPADPAFSYRAIENLIAAYAELLVDGGDFAGLGRRCSPTPRSSAAERR